MSTDLTESLVQAAAHLAANGDHAAALTLLAPLEEGDGTLPVLLLKAKVLAQMRRYNDAIAAWEQVQEAEPDNAEAQEGIDRARKASEGIGRFLYRYSWATYAGVASLLVVGALVVWRGPALVRPGRQQVEAINGRLNRLEAALVPLSATRAAAKPAAPTPGPDVDAIRARIAELERLLQSRTGEIQKELAQVRGQLAKSPQPDAAAAASQSQFDTFSARIAALENQMGKDRAVLSGETTAFRQRLDQFRVGLLRSRAMDLASRRSPTDQDLIEIKNIANDLLREDMDVSWQQYARQLVQYADDYRRRRQRDQ